MKGRLFRLVALFGVVVSKLPLGTFKEAYRDNRRQDVRYVRDNLHVRVRFAFYLTSLVKYSFSFADHQRPDICRVFQEVIDRGMRPDFTALAVWVAFLRWR